MPTTRPGASELSHLPAGSLRVLGQLVGERELIGLAAQLAEGIGGELVAAKGYEALVGSQAHVQAGNHLQPHARTRPYINAPVVIVHPSVEVVGIGITEKMSGVGAAFMAPQPQAGLRAGLQVDLAQRHAHKYRHVEVVQAQMGVPSIVDCGTGVLLLEREALATVLHFRHQA
jgi:hypothetical protein